MATAYNAADSITFIQNYNDLPIRGDRSHTLQNYIDTHQPSWGVIVNPAIGVDVLVWYDAGNNLHVIQSIDPMFATSVAAPAYHTADESFVYNLEQRTAEVVRSAGDYVAAIPGAIPSPSQLVNAAIAVAVILVILQFRR